MPNVRFGRAIRQNKAGVREARFESNLAMTTAEFD
jgi:hypothetical protein